MKVLEFAVFPFYKHCLKAYTLISLHLPRISVQIFWITDADFEYRTLNIAEMPWIFFSVKRSSLHLATTLLGIALIDIPTSYLLKKIKPHHIYMN